MTASRGLAILLAAALFASGLAVGALGVHLFYAHRVVAFGAPPMPVGPMFERWLERSLELSEPQRREVGEILERSRFEAEVLRREMGPRLHAMNRQTIESIAAVLTPEQRERFEQEMTRWERRQRRFESGVGPARDRGFERRH